MVADALPRAHFVCLQRDPVFLAQSQLIARRLIVGDENRPYGTVTPEYRQTMRPGQPVEDACAYVAADRQIVARTRDSVGAERFWIVSYEQFCRDPNVLLERLGEEVLKVPHERIPETERDSIRISRSQTVDDTTFVALQRACDELGLSRSGGEYFA
jgi:hypothetical protein